MPRDTFRNSSTPDRTDARQLWGLGPGYLIYPGRVLPRATGREDGQPHATPVVGWLDCRACGAKVAQRAEGRSRLYCDVVCRRRYQRGHRPGSYGR